MPEKPKQLKRRLIGAGAIICTALAVIALSCCVLLIQYTAFKPTTILLVALGGYVAALLIALLIGWLRSRFTREAAEINGSIFGTLSLDFIQKCSFPVLLCDEKGKIVWYNTALSAQFRSRGVLYGKYIDNICNATIEGIVGEEGLEISFLSASDISETPAKTFLARGYHVTSYNKSFYIAIFEDVSELKALYQKIADEETIVAYAMIDNLDELMQYVQEIYANASTEVEAILRRHIESVGGVLRPYGRNRYLCVFAAKHLQKFERERFAILDEIREIHVGDSMMPVTISMGVAKMAGTLYEKERASQAALDLALQRGGDQVVLKTVDGVEFYGGKTKTVQKRTKVRSRVIANELLMLISSSDNVIVMGHRFADFDAFASCLAVARLAKFCGVSVYVVADKHDKNLAACFEKLSGISEYENLFVDKNEAQDLIRTGTLAVVADVNNLSICEAPDVVEAVQNLVIIDHHRKSAEFKTQPRIVYIEPSASSASELLSEFLEQILPAGTLPKVEADFLLAGILLDTKHFTHSTGVRTFSSALYLRSEGASPIDAQNLFKMEITDFLSEAKFESNVVIYKSVIAIALNENEDNPAASRVNAARAADRLLGVDGVQAAFALCRIGETVHISARSQGKINVQLILEKVGGGGHFDAAGAQMKSSSTANALTSLRAAIDEYLAENM